MTSSWSPSINFDDSNDILNSDYWNKFDEEEDEEEENNYKVKMFIPEEASEVQINAGKK